MLIENQILTAQVLENNNDSLIVEWKNEDFKDNVINKNRIPDSFGSAKFGDYIYAKIKDISDSKVEFYDWFLSKRVRKQ